MPKPWTRLEHSLLLLDGYLHPRFGRRFAGAGKDLQDMSRRATMRTVAAWRNGYCSCPPPVPQAVIWTYDDNIKRHLDASTARPVAERIVLKYFQQLALLYTEHVLHRFFLDRAAFLADLNAVLPASAPAVTPRRTAFRPSARTT